MSTYEVAMIFIGYTTLVILLINHIKKITTPCIWRYGVVI